TFVAVKKVNDVTRLQALVDKKKVIITEATIRDALRLDDAEGVECLPNEEIFAELAKMGYEKPSTKLTFYKAFFSSQWKFFDSHHTLILVRNVDSPTKFYMYPRFLKLMIRKQVGDLSTHTTKYSSHTLTQKVFANMRRVGKGFSRVETSLFEGMIVEQPVGESANEVHDEGVLADGVAAADVVPIAVEEPSIPSPTPPTLPPQPSQDQPSTSQVQLTPPQSPQAQPQSPQHQPQPSQDAGTSMDLLQNLMDTYVDDILEDAKEVTIEKSVDVDEKPAEIQEVVEVVTTAKLITEVVTAASATITAAPQLTTVVAPTLTTAPSAARRRKGVVIRDPKETATPSTIIYSKAKSRDKGKGILRKQKEDNAMKRYQALKRKPQAEAQARKNMMIYLRNVDGFKMDYFKGMTYDDIRPIFEKHFNFNVAFLLKTKEQMDEEDSRALKRLSESQEDKAAKKKKLDEEVEELRRHLQIVPNDEDDVYTEATPLVRKVPVVDYEIYNVNNKPYYKINRANGSHQLYLSILSMIRNFNREDLEVLWQLVKERFASIKPKNFFDDFLLITLRAMFEKPDIQA
nr:hypothetical protein [Tanacetum cinerariifolium]